MKNARKTLIFAFCFFGFSLSFSEAQAVEPQVMKTLDAEFAAVRKLEAHGEVLVSGDASEADFFSWEDGRLLTFAESEDGAETEVPAAVGEIQFVCESFTQKEANLLLCLPHLRWLSLSVDQFAEPLTFPISRFTKLTRLELTAFSEPETESEPDEETDLTENSGPFPVLPDSLFKEIGRSQTLRWLSIQDENRTHFPLRSFAGMTQLWSLELEGGAPIPPEELRPLLPLRRSLHELSLTLAESQLPEAGAVLARLEALQVLRIQIRSDPNAEKEETARRVDEFLTKIQNLRLSALHLKGAVPGTAGVALLSGWNSLEECVLAPGTAVALLSGWNSLEECVPEGGNDLPAELKRVTRTHEFRNRKGKKGQQTVPVFFRDANQVFRPGILGPDGNYVHWNELSGGIWMAGPHRKY